MATQPLRVVIIGGHPVIRGVVRLACGGVEGASVVAEASTLAEAAEVVADARPDLLVLDLDLPDGDGIEILERLADERIRDQEGSPLRLLVLSDRDDGASVLEALRLGASGYLTKSEGLRGLTTALRRVAAGHRVVPPELEERAVTELGRFARQARERADIEAAITPREREVLFQLAEGLTTQQIGRRLSISPRTVETHVSKLYRKLDVSSRVQAVSRAASLGLIDLGDRRGPWVADA